MRDADYRWVSDRAVSQTHKHTQTHTHTHTHTHTAYWHEQIDWVDAEAMTTISAVRSKSTNLPTACYCSCLRWLWWRWRLLVRRRARCWLFVFTVRTIGSRRMMFGALRHDGIRCNK